MTNRKTQLANKLYKGYTQKIDSVSNTRERLDIRLCTMPRALQAWIDDDVNELMGLNQEVAGRIAVLKCSDPAYASGQRSIVAEL